LLGGKGVDGMGWDGMELIRFGGGGVECGGSDEWGSCGVKSPMRNVK